MPHQMTHEQLKTFALEMYQSATLLEGKQHHTCSYLYILATEGYMKALILKHQNNFPPQHIHQKKLRNVLESLSTEGKIPINLQDFPEETWNINCRYHVSESIWNHPRTAQNFKDKCHQVFRQIANDRLQGI